MTTARYNRSTLISFFELSETQKQDVLGYMELEDAEETSFVELDFINSESEAIPLSMFMLTNGGIWDGYYTITNTSAYFIKFNKSNSEALIASKYW